MADKKTPVPGVSLAVNSNLMHFEIGRFMLITKRSLFALKPDKLEELFSQMALLSNLRRRTAQVKRSLNLIPSEFDLGRARFMLITIKVILQSKPENVVKF